MRTELISKPYDYKSFIEVYIYTKRQDFPHQDSKEYYSKLLEKLEGLFGIQISEDPPTFDGQLFRVLFNSTVESVLTIKTPVDGYLEAGLLWRKLEQKSELNKIIHDSMRTISQATERSQLAYREILYALFRCIYGDVDTIITSSQLEAVGFNDSKEPKYVDYLENL
jgi:hypothetical protein